MRERLFTKQTAVPTSIRVGLIFQSPKLKKKKIISDLNYFNACIVIIGPC